MPTPIVILVDDPQYFSIQYHDFGNPQRRRELEAQWQSFNRTDPSTRQSLKIRVRPTNRAMEVSADYRLPADAPAGRYRIETYIPGRNATARKALYVVTFNVSQASGQPPYQTQMTLVDQSELYDVWVSLGEYELDPAAGPLEGRVRQVDLSQEDPMAELSFGPVRYVSLNVRPPDGSPRFDSPVGTEEERSAAFGTGAVMFKKYPIWCGQWFDYNPFLTWYSLGYHTGADLNLPGASGADKGKPIYAIGDGTVTYAGKASSWGYIVVIEHPSALVTLPNGTVQRQKIYSRYGHVESEILVRAGQEVARGDQVGTIGLADGYVSGWHLHFDICYTDMLKRRPAHWPDLGTYGSVLKAIAKATPRAVRSSKESIMREVINNYIDPYRFLQDNHQG